MHDRKSCRPSHGGAKFDYAPSAWMNPARFIVGYPPMIYAAFFSLPQRQVVFVSWAAVRVYPFVFPSVFTVSYRMVGGKISYICHFFLYFFMYFIFTLFLLALVNALNVIQRSLKLSLHPHESTGLCVLLFE